MLPPSLAPADERPPVTLSFNTVAQPKENMREGRTYHDIHRLARAPLPFGAGQPKIDVASLAY